MKIFFIVFSLFLLLVSACGESNTNNQTDLKTNETNITVCECYDSISYYMTEIENGKDVSDGFQNIQIKCSDLENKIGNSEYKRLMDQCNISDKNVYDTTFITVCECHDSILYYFTAIEEGIDVSSGFQNIQKECATLEKIMGPDEYNTQIKACKTENL